MSSYGDGRRPIRWWRIAQAMMARLEALRDGADGRYRRGQEPADRAGARSTIWPTIYAANPSATLVSGRDRCRALGHQVHARHRADDLHRRISRNCIPSARATGALTLGAGGDLHRGAGADRASTSRSSRELWDRIGGGQVRNAGTVGANIANGSPIGDTPPPLIALGAHDHAAQGQRAARGEAQGLLHRLWQAGPAAGRVRRERDDPAICRRASSSPATRSPSARTRTSRRCAARSACSSTTTAWWAWRASPSAAWRRRRSAPRRWRRRWSASRGRRRRSRRRSRRSPTDFQPLTDMRASSGIPAAGGAESAAAVPSRDDGRGRAAEQGGGMNKIDVIAPARPRAGGCTSRRRTTRPSSRWRGGPSMSTT